MFVADMDNSSLVNSLLKVRQNEINSGVFPDEDSKPLFNNLTDFLILLVIGYK